MSLRYLPEHAENALLALELANKKAAHLQYKHRTLFKLPIDAVWVRQLAVAEAVAIKANEISFPPNQYGRNRLLK